MNTPPRIICLALVLFTSLGLATTSRATWIAKVLHMPSWVRSECYGVMGNVQLGYAEQTFINTHATSWTGTPASATSLMPPGANYSVAYAGLNGKVVGKVDYPGTSIPIKATMWDLNANTITDLHPAALGNHMSRAYGLSNNSQVGDVTPSSRHAALWRGTAASFVDLHPAGYGYSTAQAATDSYQVGYGSKASNDHALLWTGSAASVIDLNPAGIDSSNAWAAADNKQGGQAGVRAAMWSGTAGSFVNMHPFHLGNAASGIYGMSGNLQVGYYGDNTINRAALWTGTAASAIDLHNLLPAGYAGSTAYAVDSVSGVIVGSAYRTAGSSNYEAVMWYQPVPEPASMLTLGAGAALIARRRKARRT